MATTIQRSGSRGEIAPDFWARPDLVPFHSGFKACRNFYTKKQGDVENRGGLAWAGEAWDSSKKVRQIPFKFSNSDAYFLIFGDQTLYFQKNGQFVFDSSPALTACTNANPAVVTFTGATTWQAGDMVYITGVTGPMAQYLNNRYFILGVVVSGTPSTAGLKYMDGTAVDSTAWGAGTFTGATINHVYYISTPYAIADVPNINYGQNFNIMQFVHPNYPIQQLTRQSNASWTMTTYYGTPNQGPITSGLTPVAATGTPVTYYNYVVSAVNLQTGEESYPGWRAALLVTGVVLGNPCKITVASTTGYPSGWQYLIEGTGIPQLDNKVFNMDVDGDGIHFNLRGVDSTTFPPWVSGGSVGIIQTQIQSADPTEANPITLTWDNTNPNYGTIPPQGFMYVIYKSIGRYNTNFGFVGTSLNLNFTDPGIDPDLSQTPQLYNPLFLKPGDFPSAVTYYQQRLGFFSTKNDPLALIMSQIKNYNNFSTHNPIVASDSIIADVASNGISLVTGAIDIGFLILLTDIKPFILSGDSNGAISPLAINAKNQAYLGAAAQPQPLLVGKNILYTLIDGSTTQDLQVLQTLWGSYIGETDDVSIFSYHLSQGKTRVAWAFQQFPTPIIWSVWSDGTITSLTYDFKMQITGWARHDTFGGLAEDVCCIQQGTQSVVQFVINRTIKGETKRFFEQVAPHFQADVRYYNFLDSSLTYDGTKWAGANLNFVLSNDGSGDNTWSDTDAGLILTAGSAAFTASMVGQILQFPTFTDAQGNPIWFTINAYTSGTVVRVTVSAQTPVSMQSGENLTPSVLAIQTVYGLWNLEGQTVSVFADGYEAGNAITDPNPLVVTNGSIVLDQPYGVITIGLPIIADLETLPYDFGQAPQTTVDQKKNQNKVNLGVVSTRGLWVGSSFPAAGAQPVMGSMVELQARDVQDGYFTPDDLATGFLQRIISGKWRFNPSICIRQVSPVPVTITSIAPSWIE